MHIFLTLIKASALFGVTFSTLHNLTQSEISSKYKSKWNLVRQLALSECVTNEQIVMEMQNHLLHVSWLVLGRNQNLLWDVWASEFSVFT